MAVLATIASLSLIATGTAFATHDGWVAQPGTSVDGDAVVLDTTDEDQTPAGTSFEHDNLGVSLEAGDQITFDYVLTEGAVCGGGQPRIFVEVDDASFNTFDGNDEGDCGELVGQGTTEGTVVATYDGPDGLVGHAGIVFDNPADRGVATITNVQIGDYVLDVDHEPEPDDPSAKDECKQGGWEEFDFRNQGQCIRFVNTDKDSR